MASGPALGRRATPLPLPHADSARCCSGSCKRHWWSYRHGRRDESPGRAGAPLGSSFLSQSRFSLASTTVAAAVLATVLRTQDVRHDTGPAWRAWVAPDHPRAGKKCRNLWQWPIQRCGSALSRSTRVEIRAATPKTSYQWHRDLAQPQWLTHRGPDQLVAAAGARGCGIIQTPTGLSPVACCGCAQDSRRVSVTKTHKLRFTLAPPQTSSPGVKRVSVVFAGKAPTCSKMSFAWDKGRGHSWYTYTLLFLYFYGFTYVTFLGNSFVFRFEAFSCLNISPSPSLPFWLQRASAARTPMHMLLWLT